MKKFFTLTILISLILLFFSIQKVVAGTATLSWNANTEVDLAGYKIYYGTSPRTSSCPPGGYPNKINVGKVTSYTINNLTDGQTYYFSLTAYDTSGNESCFSSEVSKKISSPDTTPPSAPTNLTATAISSSQINLSWTASTDNVGVVGYKIYRCSGSGCLPTIQIATSTTNSYTDSNLSPSTTYVYKISAYDAAGNVSSQSSSISAITNQNQLSLPGWTFCAYEYQQCSFSGTKEVRYGDINKYITKTFTNGVFCDNSIFGDPAVGINKQCHYRDASDITPPVISNILVSNITTSSVTITWTTNEDSDSQVEYGLTSSYGNLTNLNTSTTIYHSQSLSDLSANTTYHFRVKSKDTAGNLSVSTDKTFTTLNLTTNNSGGGSRGGSSGGGGSSGDIVIDTIPPSQPQEFKAELDNKKIILSWKNPKDSDFSGVLIIRKEGSSPTSRIDGKIIYDGKSESFVDINLDNNKTYYYAIYAYDKKLNYSQPVIINITPTISEETIVFVKVDGPFYLGQSSDQVKILQQMLAKDKDIYPEKEITGFYGPLTRKAVERFQCKYMNICQGSPESNGYGLAGPATRAKINEIFGGSPIIESQIQPQISTTTTKTTQKEEIIAQLKEKIQQLQLQLIQLLNQLMQLLQNQNAANKR